MDIFDIVRPEEIKNELSLANRARLRRGEPNCIAYAANYIAVGLYNPSGLLIWNVDELTCLPVTLNEGSLSCIDFSWDADMLVCGFDSGLIGFVDVNKGVMLQTFRELHSSRILTIKFIYKLHQEQMCIATVDTSGRSAAINFKKGFFTYEVNPVPIFKQMAYPAASMKVLASGDDVRYVVLANIQKFWILRIKINSNGLNELTTLFEHENPLKTSKAQVFSTSCAIGRGLVKNNKKSIDRKFVAVCCWDTVLFTITSDDLDSKQINLQKYIYLETRALDISFVKDSLFVIVTLNKGVLMMNTINIINTDVHRKLCDCRYIGFPETVKFQYVGQDMKIPGFYMSECMKRFRSAVQTMLKKTTLIIEQTPPTNYNIAFSGNLVVLQPNGVSLVHTAKYSKVLQSFYEQGEWMNGMHYLLSVYLCSNRYITDFMEITTQERQQLLMPVVHDIAIKYHRMIMGCISTKHESEFVTEEQLKETTQNQCTLFAMLIEFLLLNDSFDFLFDDIMPKTKAIMKDNDALFLKCIEPFYQECMVKYIPQSTLMHILEIYKQQNRIDLIQKLIRSLDHRRLDTSQLIKMSLKLGLLKSLAIICAKGDAEEFLTPVVKIWSVILLMISKHQFDLAKYYALRALSFIKLAMRRKDILGNDLDSNKANEIVKALSLWVLKEENLERLLTLTPAPAFEVITLMLSDQAAQLVNQIRIYKPEQYTAEFVLDKDTNSSKVVVLVELIREKILNSHEDSGDSANFQYLLRSNSMAQQSEHLEEDVSIQFTLFQVRLYLNKQIPLRNKRIIQCVAYILKNLQSLNAIYLTELLKPLTFIRREEMRKWPHPKEVLEYLKSEYVLSVIKLLEKNATKSEHKEILELSHLADLTSLSTICIHLAVKKNEYKRALDFYLYSKNQLVKLKVFDWMFPAMEHLEKHDPTQYEDMKQYMIQKLTDLIQVNSASTRDLFSRYNSESEKVVINKLELYPELQLEYVENVIKKERDLGHKVDNQLLILNISLLCRLNPDKILEEVREFEYPLDNILQPCRQYGIRRATAYVLERLGSIQEAVHMYCDIFREIVRGNLKELNYQYDLSTKLGGGEKQSAVSALFNKGGQQNMMQTYEAIKQKTITEVNDEIYSIIKVCQFNNKFDSTDEIWYILMDCLIDVRDHLLTNKDCEVFLKDICTLQVCHIIALIAESSNLDILLIQLQERYTDLDMGQLKITFQEIISNYIYVETVLTNSKGLVQADIVKRVELLLDKYSRGFQAKHKCAECHHELTKDGTYASQENDNIIFTCGHAYHRGCAVEQQNLVLCQICCKKDQQYAYKLLFLNAKIKLDKLSESLQLKQKEPDEILNSDEEEKPQMLKLMDNDTIVKPKVSKEVEILRKRRTNKLNFWDRKRLENLHMIEETNADIDAFNKKQAHEELLKQQHEEAQAAMKKSKRTNRK